MIEATTVRDVRGIEDGPSSESWLHHTLAEMLHQLRRLPRPQRVRSRPSTGSSGSSAPSRSGSPSRTRWPSRWPRSSPATLRPCATGSSPRARPRAETAARREHRGLAGGAAPARAPGRDSSTRRGRGRRSSFISCPVRTAAGRRLGVLTVSTTRPQPPLGEEDLRAVEAFAGIAVLVLERAERVSEERLLNEAAQEVSSPRPERAGLGDRRAGGADHGRAEGRAVALRAGDAGSPARGHARDGARRWSASATGSTRARSDRSRERCGPM